MTLVVLGVLYDRGNHFFDNFFFLSEWHGVLSPRSFVRMTFFFFAVCVCFFLCVCLAS